MRLRGTGIRLLCVIVIAGCGLSSSDVSKDRLKSMAGGSLKEVVPVSGKVLVDGQPVNGVMLELWSKVDDERPCKKVVAGTDGKYCWSKYTPCDGLEPGVYKVTFKHLQNPMKEKSDDLFGGRYSDVTKTEYELTVEAAKPQVNVDYNLSTK